MIERLILLILYGGFFLDVYRIVIKIDFKIIYDKSGSIGRRYRRVDEIGVPISITVDYQTIEDNTITIRDRDSMKQTRVNIEKLKNELYKKFS